MKGIPTALACLYLDGFDHPSSGLPRGQWPRVAALLQSDGPAALQQAGFWEHARRLESSPSAPPGSVLSAVCPAYPQKLLRALPASEVPPVFWAQGQPAAHRWVAIVGTRQPQPSDPSLVRDLVSQIGAAGYGVVSGGALGIDSLACQACRQFGVPLLEFLPSGLVHRPLPCQLSVCAPGKAFSTLQAIQRNLLIYASADLAIAFHPRFKQGGTWHGALEALRRKLCPVQVVGSSPAAQALEAAGASPFLGEFFAPAAPLPVHPRSSSAQSLQSELFDFIAEAC